MEIPSQFIETPTGEEAPASEYSLLAGHARTNGSWKTGEQLRAEYVNLTDELVQQMVGGVEVEDPQTHEKTIERPDFVVWLDKSARPVSWLTRDLWPLLAQDRDGNTAPMPEFKYVNIDREQWVSKVDPTGEGYTDVAGIDPSIIRSLRSIFVPPQYKEKGLTPEIDTAPSEMDGKTILVVDEVRSTGRTLEYTRGFFGRAFPTCKIATTHWMKGMVARDGAVGNADLPVWYRRDLVIGRGVGDRDDDLSAQSKSLTQRLGRFFLSTRLPDPDWKSSQLRRELHTLSEDAKSGKVLIIPSLGRELNDFDERAERLNNTDLPSFVEKVQRLKRVA